jgi:RNA polymerase sigma-70 factor (ECF subfamily)
MDKMVDMDNFIERLRHKDLKALDYLVDRYSDLALKVSYTVLNNRELSEECTNDVLLKIWDNISSFKGSKDDFVKWFVVITKRYAIDLLRKEIKHSNSLELMDEIGYIHEDSAFDKVNKSLEGQVVRSTLQKLDEGSREIIVRRYFKDESIDEISADLGISKNAVSNRLLRSKKKLKDVLMEGNL